MIVCYFRVQWSLRATIDECEPKCWKHGHAADEAVWLLRPVSYSHYRASLNICDAVRVERALWQETFGCAGIRLADHVLASVRAANVGQDHRMRHDEWTVTTRGWIMLFISWSWYKKHTRVKEQARSMFTSFLDNVMPCVSFSVQQSWSGVAEPVACCAGRSQCAEA